MRPLSAPAGYWKFNVLSTVGIAYDEDINSIGIPYPNPAKNFAAVSLSVTRPVLIAMTLHDFTGRIVRDVYTGSMQSGERLISIDVRGLSPGIYFLEVITGSQKVTRKISVR